MRKLLLLLLFAMGAELHAQVAIGGATAPVEGAILDLNKTAKGGLVLSNVTLTDLFTIPAGFPGMTPTPAELTTVKTAFKGAVVYHDAKNGSTIPAGVYVWNGTNWTTVKANCLPLTPSNLNLSGPAAAKTNEPVSFSVSFVNVDAACLGDGTYQWSYREVTTPSYTSVADATTNTLNTSFATGVYLVKVEVTNPPYTAGVDKERLISIGGAAIPEEMKLPGYYLTGKPCYDVNKSDFGRADTNDEARIGTATDFDTGKKYIYKFYHEKEPLDLTINLVGGDEIVSSYEVKKGGEYDEITITFDDQVEATVTGTAFPMKLLLSYKADANSDTKYADMDISVQDSLCGCPAKAGNDRWFVFQCHNLGGLDIFTGNELEAGDVNSLLYHGDWYRWGAKTASLKNDNATYDYDKKGTEDPDFVAAWEALPYQATNVDDPDDPSQNVDDPNQTDESGNNLWKAENNPCPAGWHVPTIAEWLTVAAQNLIDQTITYPTGSSGVDNYHRFMGFGDYLYLPVTGYRSQSPGGLNSRGHIPYYWSSSANIASAWTLAWDPEGKVSKSREDGVPVRCVAAE